MRDKPAVSSQNIPGSYKTSAAWMRAVEGFFAALSRQQRKPAIFNTLGECIAVIKTCVKRHNANDARPFRGAGSPKLSWRHGEWDARNRRNRHREKEPNHYAAVLRYGRQRKFQCTSAEGAYRERVSLT